MSEAEAIKSIVENVHGHPDMFRECTIYRGGNERAPAYRGPLWAGICYLLAQGDQTVRTVEVSARPDTRAATGTTA